MMVTYGFIEFYQRNEAVRDKLLLLLHAIAKDTRKEDSLVAVSLKSHYPKSIGRCPKHSYPGQL
jgi:hypothetical protein